MTCANTLGTQALRGLRAFQIFKRMEKDKQPRFFKWVLPNTREESTGTRLGRVHPEKKSLASDAFCTLPQSPAKIYHIKTERTENS